MYQQGRRRAYELLAPHHGGRLGVITDWFILTLIALNVVAVMLETVDWIHVAYSGQFYRFEIVSIGVFTVEYLGRVWSCLENPRFDGPVSGRVRFASRPLLIIDLLAILPFYLIVAGWQLDLRFLRMVRLVRIFRLIHLTRYNESLRVFADVLRAKRARLTVAITGTLVVWVITSSIMYIIEHEAQPEVFSSIPATLWWGIITLTTVGYGDTYPITALGKVFGTLVALLGVGVVALPASILASGFVEEATTDNGSDGPAYCPCCGTALNKYR